MNPTTKLTWPNGGPMLAENIDDVDVLYFPMLGQPKLNGIRACWTGEHLISRQRKVWKPTTLPTLFERLRNWSKSYPGMILDGELYCHGMPFQEIESITSVNRLTASVHEARIEYHAFDIISDDHTESRQVTLQNAYSPWVACCKVDSQQQAELWTNRFVEAGFEGLMLRSYKCPYINGRTEALIKVKPWKYGRAIVIGHTPGKGKYTGMVGALKVKDTGTQKQFNVAGGLSDVDREQFAGVYERHAVAPIYVNYRYRELSKSGIPLQPQIVRMHL